MDEYPKVIRVDGIVVTVPNEYEEARWRASGVPEDKIASTVVVVAPETPKKHAEKPEKSKGDKKK